VSDKEVAALFAREDFRGLLDLARAKTSRVVRYLTGRLYSSDDDEKWRAVRALGAMAADQGIFSGPKMGDLLRRFFWSLNDESGAVPFGIPEAIGEILAVRSEFQADFLPVLCSMLIHEDMIQTGPIERGVIWALGRVGPPVAVCCQQTLPAVEYLWKSHPDDKTRQLAGWALERIKGK
jgi:hypothetical protein